MMMILGTLRKQSQINLQKKLISLRKKVTTIGEASKQFQVNQKQRKKSSLRKQVMTNGAVLKLCQIHLRHKSRNQVPKVRVTMTLEASRNHLKNRSRMTVLVTSKSLRFPLIHSLHHQPRFRR